MFVQLSSHDWLYEDAADLLWGTFFLAGTVAKAGHFTLNNRLVHNMILNDSSQK